MLLQDLACFAASLPEQPVAQGGQCPSSGCVTTGPALSISSPWHDLSEAPLLQAQGGIGSDHGVQTLSQLLSAFMSEVFHSSAVGKGYAGFQTSSKTTEIGFSDPCLLLSCLPCLLWFWEGNKGWGWLQHAQA